MSAISDGSAQPSTTGTSEVDLCFSRFTADQKPVFFLFVNDLASLSRVSWFCLRFKWRTEDLYFLLVLFLTSDKAPVRGQPASLQTLYQKSALGLYMNPSRQLRSGKRIIELESSDWHKQSRWRQVYQHIHQVVCCAVNKPCQNMMINL